MTERRAYQREDLMLVVNYIPSPFTSATILRGCIKDWSGSGICLMTLQPLDEGEEIIVDSIVVPKSNKGVVKWNKKLGNGTYKLGVEIRR